MSEPVLIVGGGPGISASCARLFSSEGYRVAVAARNPEKSVLNDLRDQHNTTILQADASNAESVAQLFQDAEETIGAPRLVIHNIDGRNPNIFRKSITEAAPEDVLSVMINGVYSAFLVGQQAASRMLKLAPNQQGKRGTILFTNASAALKGFPKSGAFAISCHGKAGLTQSMARELMPQGVHVAHIPIDAAIGWTQADGSRAHRLAGETVDDNMADPDRIAEVYLQLHRQHRSTWTDEVVLRPWTETW